MARVDTRAPAPRGGWTPLGSRIMSELKSPLPAVVDELWERRAELSPEDSAARAEIVAAVDQIDAGTARVAFVDAETDEVVVDERAKRAILLAFKVLPMAQSQVGDFRYHDRVPLKTRLDGVRVVPGAIARWGAYIAPGTVLMPSFTNVGAYVDTGTMVDTWATVGSCAQIGKNVHLSGGVGHRRRARAGQRRSRSWSRTSASSAPGPSWPRAPGCAPARCSDRGPTSPRQRT